VDTPTAAGSYQVKAAIAGGNSSTSAVQSVAAPDLRFSTPNGTLTVGKGLNSYSQEVYVYRTVNGTNLNGTSAVTVNLACSSTVICNVPATVTIPAGQYRIYFTVTGAGVGSTTVTASASGYSATQDLSVNVVTPQLNFSGPSNTTVGHMSNFNVHMTTPGAYYSGNQAAASAISVNLTSSAPGVATVPSTTTIPAGSTLLQQHCPDRCCRGYDHPYRQRCGAFQCYFRCHYHQPIDGHDPQPNTQDGSHRYDE
jgi:hypothetical protein